MCWLFFSDLHTYPRGAWTLSGRSGPTEIDRKQTYPHCVLLGRDGGQGKYSSVTAGEISISLFTTVWRVHGQGQRLPRDMRLKDGLAKGRIIKDLLTQSSEISLQDWRRPWASERFILWDVRKESQSHRESNVSKKRQTCHWGKPAPLKTGRTSSRSKCITLSGKINLPIVKANIF